MQFDHRTCSQIAQVARILHFMQIMKAIFNEECQRHKKWFTVRSSKGKLGKDYTLVKKCKTMKKNISEKKIHIHIYI